MRGFLPKKPWLRRLVLVVGACGALTLLGLAILRVPAVQLRLVKYLVARQPGWRFDAERIDVGPTGAEARGMDFTMPGVAASGEPLSVRLRPWRLLRHQELNIERVSADRLRIEITPADLATPPVSMPAAVVPFDGVLSLLRAPLPWAVGTTEVTLDLVVREGGAETVAATLHLKGGGLSARTPGTFTYELGAGPGGAANQTRSKGSFTITQDAANGVSLIELQGDLRLPAPPGLPHFTPPPGTLALTIAATPAGENYTATFNFGPAATCTLTAHLDRATQTLRGMLEGAADERIAAQAAATPLPNARATGKLDFAFSLANGATELRLVADLALAKLGRLRPELAALGPLHGTARIEAGRDAQGRDWMRPSTLTLRDASPAPAAPGFLLEVAAESAHAARLTLRSLPLAWANPALVTSGIRLNDGHAGGEWRLTWNATAQELHATPAAPLSIGPISLTGDAVASLNPPPLTLLLSPALRLTATRATITLADFSATTPDGDQLLISGQALYDFATSLLDATGELRAISPALPFALTARGAGEFNPTTGGKLKTLELAAVAPSAAQGENPLVSVNLLQPLALDATGRPAPPAASADAGPALAELKVSDFPLNWAARWLGGATLAGTWAEGAGELRATDATGGLAWRTTRPWVFTGLALGPAPSPNPDPAPTPVFHGEATLSPAATWSPERWSAGVKDLRITRTEGGTLVGEAELALETATRAFKSSVSLDADLPPLTPELEPLGPLQVRLRGRAATAQGMVAQADDLELSMRNAAGPLIALTSSGPVIVAYVPGKALFLATEAPLWLRTGALPLAWTRAWWPAGLELAGTVEPLELALVLEPQSWHLRPTQLARVSGLELRRDGRVEFTDASISGYPGLDFTMPPEWAATFKPVFSGALHFTEGVVKLGETKALDFESGLEFVGNDEVLLPSEVSLQLRSDIAAWRAAPAFAFWPAGGHAVARLSGKVLGGGGPDQGLQLWTRLDGVPAPEAARTLAPLEANVDFKLDSHQRKLALDVRLAQENADRAGDLAFQLSFMLGEGIATLDTDLRGAFWDVGELLALGDAFTSPAAPSPRAPAVVPAASATSSGPLGTAAWSILRGRLGLDLAELRHAPYTVKGVRGRVDLTDTHLTISDLGAEMFGGRLGGGLTVEHVPGRSGADHVLQGALRIDKLDTDEVVRTAFKDSPGTLAARLDLEATVRGEGYLLRELLNRAEANFTLTGGGVARLTHPDARTAATLLVLGGVVTFSPELRALGRLVRKLSEMPIDTLRITGGRDATGRLTLGEVLLESPQMRLIGEGAVPVPLDPDTPLAARDLQVSLRLAARDELGVILGNMRLLERKPGADGFRPMIAPFVVAGQVGQPDVSALYDLFAKGVAGSRGTWGLVMRKVRGEIEKQQAAERAKPTSSTP